MASFGGQAADGMRAQRLAREREQGKDEADFMKKKLSDQLKVANIESKFASTYDAVEQEIKVGEKVDKMNLDWLLWDPKIRCKLLLGKKSTQKVIVMGQTDRWSAKRTNPRSGHLCIIYRVSHGSFCFHQPL